MFMRGSDMGDTFCARLHALMCVWDAMTTRICVFTYLRICAFASAVLSRYSVAASNGQRLRMSFSYRACREQAQIFQATVGDAQKEHAPLSPVFLQQRREQARNGFQQSAVPRLLVLLARYLLGLAQVLGKHLRDFVCQLLAV